MAACSARRRSAAPDGAARTSSLHASPAPTLWSVREEPRYGWIIATGERRDVATRAAQAQVIDLVDRMHFDPHGYAWIMRTDGRLIVNPFVAGEARAAWNPLPGSDRLQDPTGSFVITSMVDTCRRDGAGFVQYLWPVPEAVRPRQRQHT